MRSPCLTTSTALVFLFGGIIVANYAHSADKYERKVPYKGEKMTSFTLMCSASHLAAGGFWRKPDSTVDEGARIEKEPKPTYWKVTISEKQGIAQVIRFNTNFEELGAPALFSAEVTPGGGILMVQTDREPGTSPETISIDPTNSSFVYSSQHANSLYNRANIWYGSCKPSL